MVEVQKDGTTTQQDLEIFNELIREYHKNVDLVHVIQETSTYVTDNFDFLPFTLDSNMINDLVNRNLTSEIIPDEVRSPVMLISEEEVSCYFQSAISSIYYGWEKYYETYPDSKGIIHFSLPGFDLEEKLAVVQYSESYGDLGASGYIAILQKQQGKWVALNRYVMWIS